MQEVHLSLIDIRKVINVADFTARKEMDVVNHVMRYEFRALFTGTRQDPYSFHYFDSLWEHFKDRWFPKWMKKRWPGVKRELRIDVALLYPQLKSELPRELMGDRVCLMLRGPERTSFSMFDPDQPLPEHEFVWKMADKVPLFNPSDPRCPSCRKPWRYE